ncbi:MAG: phospholipase D family protein [Puniceicoccaceae bacterium]
MIKWPFSIRPQAINAGLLLAGLCLTACTTLKPVEKPVETALAPVENTFWDEIDSVRQERDWYYLLNTGPEGLEWRLRAIDSASQSIDLQTFLWMWDESGSLVLRHLLEAADRGVRVRLLLDDTFLNTHSDIVWDLGHHTNVEYRIYNPFKRRRENFAMRQLINLGEFGRLDHRMHNKAMIVDNRAAIVGGRNLADEYFGSHEEANFRDIEVLTAGPGVLGLSDLFDEFWNNPWTFPLEAIMTEQPAGMDRESFETWIYGEISAGLEESRDERLVRWMEAARQADPGSAVLLADHPARDNPADHDELPDQLAIELNEWFGRAEKELILVSAYLIPTPELEAAIEAAENRGVRVRILTNSLRSNNHVAAHSAYRHHIHSLLGHGAEVHEVRALAKDRGTYIRHPVEEKELGLHAKLVLIDDNLTFIGSANLDPRSLRLNTEMGLLIESPSLNTRVREVLDLDFLLRNAWHLEVGPDGQVIWKSDEEVLETQPAASAFQKLEDWFLGILPIEGEM